MAHRRHWRPGARWIVLVAVTLFGGVAVDEACARSQSELDDLGRAIGQLLLVGFQGASPSDPSVAQTVEQLSSGRISGVLLLDRNISSPQQVRHLTTALHAATPGTPPFIAVDQEGGRIQRLSVEKGFGWVPAASDLARQNTTGDGAFQTYLSMATELASVGINYNLAPVVDLKIRRDGIIGGLGRSYSADPSVVTLYARRFVQAHRVAGVLTALKHFPGHGSTSEDSHRSLPDISKTWTEAELVPYRELIRDGYADTVMLGHLAHPRFSDGASTPASLSRRTISILRAELGFDGVVVTDDLHMDGIGRRYAEGEAAIEALRAGADLLIYSSFPHYDPALVDRIHDAIREAVADGRLSLRQIEASARRIGAMKQRLPMAITGSGG